MPDEFLRVELADEAATAALAEDVASCLAPGDALALAGDLGAGKTTFARALIRALAEDPALEVPSPTFTLAQAYATPRLNVTHIDLYRVADASELEEIGLAEALVDGAVLVEWPEKAAGLLPVDALEVRLEAAGDQRVAILTGSRSWQARLARARTGRALLDANGWRGAHRSPIAGDASARRYERIRDGERSAVLMHWPQSEIPAVKDGRGAFRAKDLRAFLAVDAALREAGFSAPEIYATDVANGLILMEDFGEEGIVEDDRPIEGHYLTAIEVLATIHTRARPESLAIPGGSGEHRLPALDAAALHPEVALYADWYVPHVTAAPLDANAQAAFASLWSALFEKLADAARSWVLFDVQSANLLWLADRVALRRLGLIDFQDMFVGPSAYDVASLCHDARVTVPEDLERELRRHYVALRQAASPHFDTAAFAESYAILTALRTMKNMGVFARLADHEGRTDYLRHLPRLQEYLSRAFKHPVLSDLAVWYDTNVYRQSGEAPPQ